MGSVQLKISPSLASMATATWFSTNFVVESPIDGSTTVGEVLAGFSRERPEFTRVIFDAATGKISDEINVVLNQSLLISSEAGKVRVKDGDSILLMPIYTGG